MKTTRNRVFSLAIFLLIVNLVSACHTQGPIPMPESGSQKTQPLTTEVPSDVPTPTRTHTATPTQTPTPTLCPADFWAEGLPEAFMDRIQLPTDAVWHDDPETSRYHIKAFKAPVAENMLAQTNWTYVLAAPFFTVLDDISLADLKAFLKGNEPDFGFSEESKVLLQKGDQDAILNMLGLDSAKRIQAVASLEDIKADAWSETWAIVPFEALKPEWKVISIDGVSPLDHDFDPQNYSLNLHVGLFVNDPEGHSREAGKFDPNTILPQSNRNQAHLTSLIMTGVTAMTRDTADIMETEGILFPGTEIRDFMRAADLTHISNEVSFYEDCPYPDPDYEGFLFCSNPEYIHLLEDLGADVIELTGNHNNDVNALYKFDSVPFSLDLYRQYGMQWYAGGVNVAEAKKPLLIEHNENRLAFIGCNSYGPTMAWAEEDRSGSAPCEDFGWLKAEVAHLQEEGYLPIVTFQFQEDYFQEPTSLQLQDFRDVASAGPVIINGSQSHVAKAMEFYQGSFIHYGLGNLFFDQPDFYITYDSFIQEHFFYEGRLINTRLYTITIEETGKPRPMTIEERQDFLSKIFSLSEPLGSSQ